MAALGRAILLVACAWLALLPCARLAAWQVARAQAAHADTIPWTTSATALQVVGATALMALAFAWIQGRSLPAIALVLATPFIGLALLTIAQSMP
jgi:hypothetical protein